jgi:energy-coupling factor transport system substrate-specific component
MGTKTDANAILKLPLPGSRRGAGIYTSSGPYWKPGELIVIGTFAGLIKVSTMLIALAGGGMNPVTLVLKNMVATSLLIILVYRVRKFGVLTLFSLISSIVSLLLMGGNPMSVGGAIVAGVVCDAAMAVMGRRQIAFVQVAGVALFDLLSRAASLGYYYFLYRESFKMFIIGTVVVALGYLGCLIGLWSGAVFVKELKHACIIRE